MLNMCSGNIYFMISYMYVCACAHVPTVEIAGLPILYLINLSL